MCKEQAIEGLDDPKASVLREMVIRCYPKLRELMHEVVRRHHPNQVDSLTNPPTALAHELIDRLLAQRNQMQDEAHLIAVAGLLAERVVRDDQKRRLAAKRGGGNRGHTFIEEPTDQENDSRGDELTREVVREALSRFCVEHPRAAEVTSLRMMLGLTAEQAAEVMGISLATVDRDWRFARAWLGDMLPKKLKHDGYAQRQSRSFLHSRADV